MVTQTGPMMIVRKPVTREALEWQGDNLLAVQAFMFPSSPLFHPKTNSVLDEKVSIITITTRNAEHELKFPTLGAQFMQLVVRPGDWIYRDGESFAVVRKGDYDAEWAEHVDNPVVTGRL